MQIDPLLGKVRGSLDEQLALSGLDETVEAAAVALGRVLEPVLRECAFELAAQAAAEVSAQLEGHEVEVVLVDGDPSLRVGEGRHGPVAAGEDYEARLTLRLPPTLKRIVEEAAANAGDSVNSWVVETLGSRATRPAGRRHVSGSFDL